MNRLKALQKPIFLRNGYAVCLIGFQGNRFFFEFLPDNTIVNFEVHYHQLEKLNG